jgi:hypothetical protein
VDSGAARFAVGWVAGGSQRFTLMPPRRRVPLRQSSARRLGAGVDGVDGQLEHARAAGDAGLASPCQLTVSPLTRRCKPVTSLLVLQTPASSRPSAGVSKALGFYTRVKVTSMSTPLTALDPPTTGSPPGPTTVALHNDVVVGHRGRELADSALRLRTLLHHRLTADRRSSRPSPGSTAAGVSELQQWHVVEVRFAYPAQGRCGDLDDHHFGEELDGGRQQVAGVSGRAVSFEPDG